MLPNESHCLRAKVRLSPLHVMVANQHISITYKAKGWTSPTGTSACHIEVCSIYHAKNTGECYCYHISDTIISKTT